MTSTFPTLRRTDILTGRQVIIAPGRATRPIQSARSVAADTAMYDPFLEGHEHDTPAERLALRRETSNRNGAGWLLRVVPNRYPAVTEGTASRFDSETQALPPDLFETAATGIHDVVIECPDDRSRLVELSVVEVARLLLAWQKRLQQLSGTAGVRAVSVFRNEGTGAGASLPHCHSQILATDLLNQQLSQRVAVVETHRQSCRQNGPCPYQQWLQAELSAQSRVVAIDDELAVICPFASRVTRHVRLCPIAEHCFVATPFQETSETVIRLLAAKLLSVVRGMHAIRESGSFNLNLIMPPTEHPRLFPWMLDVLPRTSQFAGFELLTDVDMLSIAPKTAAEELIHQINWLAGPDHSELLWPADYVWL